jgi:hypothetical protein
MKKMIAYSCILFSAMLLLVFTSCKKKDEEGTALKKDYKAAFAGTYNMSGSSEYYYVLSPRTYGDTDLTVTFTIGKDSDLVLLNHPVIVQSDGSFVQNADHYPNPYSYRWISGHFEGDSVYLEINTGGHEGFIMNISGTQIQ